MSSREELVEVKSHLETLETKTRKDIETIGLLNAQPSPETSEQESLEDEVENK